jgi:competence protein ComEC
MIDVGQGDGTLIITPSGKRILIDGGGSEGTTDYSVGESILLPYLLDKKINSLDYIILSHFDSDHCDGVMYLMEKIKVKNVIIAKQFEKSNNYERFKRIVKNKKIKVIIAKENSTLKIEDDLKIDFLWPIEESKVNENVLNNNSLVFQLKYKKYSFLFTGDIEEIAEKRIAHEYGKKLKADFLKVAHHGSKTSSIEEFIKAVNPKISLIGVGINNKFGHPNEEVIERLKNIGSKIYRTDEMGEITIEIKKNGKIKIEKYIK